MDKQLYPIEPAEFVIDSKESVEGGLQYKLSFAMSDQKCPFCDSSDIVKNGTRNKYIRDLPEFGQNVGLEVKMQRYLCNECGDQWTQESKSIFEQSKMTTRLYDYISKESLSKPFKQIADDLSLSPATIRNAFTEYVSELEKNYDLHAPNVLGMDENKVCGSYRCVFTDIEYGLLVDMIATREKEDVIRWLNKLPDKDRINVVVMDMWKHYRSAVQEVLPDVPIVVDKFHVVQMLNDALDDIRISLRGSMTKDERRNLRHDKWLMLRNKEDLNEKQKVELDRLFEVYPIFKEPYDLKEEFRNIYNKSINRRDALTRYAKWKKKIPEDLTEYQKFVGTVARWYSEIFNYFDYNVTNAYTEAVNALIKKEAATGRGYTFEVLRAKMIFGSKNRKPAKYIFNKPSSTPTGTYGFMTYWEDKRILVHGEGVVL